MTSQTEAHLQAHRFANRRIEYALRTGHSLPPVKTRAGYGLQATVGLVVTALMVAGAAVYGALRPAPSIGDATVLIDTDAGRVLVVSGGALHPALNLASALLAAGRRGEAPTVREVTSSTLATLPRGPTIGIASAPQQIPAPADILENTWTVCDVPQVDPARPADAPQPLRTTVLISVAATSHPPTTAPILVTVDGQSYHVLFDGQRHRVPSPADGALLRTLGLRLDDARPISTGLLNAIPEGAAIAWPVVAQAGRSVWLGARQYTVGSVVRVDREARDPAYHLILADGIQLIPPHAVDVVRMASRLAEGMTVLPPSEVAALPVSAEPIDLGEYPTERPSAAGPDRQPGLCMRWAGDGSQPAVRISLVSSLPLSERAQAVPVPPPGSAGSNSAGSTMARADRARLELSMAHAVYVEPQHGLLVRQSAADSTVEIGTLFLITDQGIAYPVLDDQALASLGLQQASVTAVPAELLSLLTTGPVLDPAAARASVRP